MSDSEDDSCVPDAKTAQSRVKEFESVTNTDEIMAQMYLQVRLSGYLLRVKLLIIICRRTSGMSPEH